MAFDTFLPPRPEIQTVLSEALKRTVQIKDLSRMSGGMVNSVVLAILDEPPGELVLKLSKNRNAFTHEARILDWLQEHTTFPAPRVYGHSTEAAPFGLLALERLEGTNLGEAAYSGGNVEPAEIEMAEAVAGLHHFTRDEFGPLLDGRRFPTWLEDFSDRFSREVRDQTVRERLDRSTMDLCERILQDLPSFLVNETPARLVHGDIWATNVIVRRVGSSWHLSGFVDCQCQYADPEYELAYLLIFHTVGQTFFDRYQNHHRIDPGFIQRRLVYDLRTMLVHVRFFGDSHYRERARRLARETARGMGL